MNTFLDRIASRLLDQSLDMRSQMVVLPSRRAITFLKNCLVQRIDKPIFLPRIITLDDLAHEITGLERLDPVTVGLELYSVYRELYEDAEDYELFDTWSGAILKDFSTIDTYLIDAEKLYTDLRYLKEINEWSFLEDELGADQEKFNHFWKRRGPLYTRFNDRLKDGGKSYAGAILRTATDEVADRMVFPEIKRMIFAGFNALSNVEIALLDKFHEEGRLEVYWDDAAFFTKNTADPAGHFMRKWKEKPWTQHFSQPSEDSCSLTIASHPHAISQCMWVGSLLADIESEDEVAVVLADESLLNPLLDQFPIGLHHVNITIGLSYKDSNVYQFVKDYFRMHIEAEKSVLSSKLWHVHYELFKRWVESAVRFDLISHNALIKVDRAVQHDRTIFFDATSIESIIGKEESVRFGLFDARSGQVLSSLESMLTHVKSKDHISKGIATRLAEIVQDSREVMAKYDFIKGSEGVWKCLKGAMSRERLSFVGEPLQGVQVMGLLETRALQFKKVILLGANEGNLPKSRSYDTFLPFDIRRHYHLPTQMEEDAIFAYYFYRLVGGARQVHIGYTSERDEFGGGEKSRYLSQLIAGLPQRAGFSAEVAEITYPTQTSNVPHVDVIVKNDDKLKVDILDYFKRGVSFSRLNEFNRCPLDFYYKTVLRLGEDQNVEEEMGTSELGNVVHDVLEESFKGRVGKGELKTSDIDDMEQSYPQLLGQILKKHGLERMVEGGESALVKAVAEKMLQNFYHRENERVSANGIEMLSLEANWEMTLDVAIDGKSIPVRFKAKMDRVERNNGQVLLIDYKTGAVQSKAVRLADLEAETLFSPDNSKALQLLYYMWFYYKKFDTICRSGIISMVGLETEPKEFELKGESMLNREDLLQFEMELFALLERIVLREEFEHDSEHGFYCSHCLEPAERKW